MAKKKRTQKISNAERARRRRQAIKNFGLSRKSRSTKRGVSKVPRKTRRKSRRYVRSVAKPASVLVGGGIYGALRERLSGYLAPFTSKIPLGSIGDEVGLFALHYWLNKKMKNKVVKDVTMAGMAVESARIGEALSMGSIFGNGSSANATRATVLA